MLGKIEGRRRRGWQRMRLVGWHHRLNGPEFEQLRQMVKDGEAWCAAVHGVTKSWTRPRGWTTRKWIFCIVILEWPDYPGSHAPYLVPLDVWSKGMTDHHCALVVFQMLGRLRSDGSLRCLKHQLNPSDGWNTKVSARLWMIPSFESYQAVIHFL